MGTTSTGQPLNAKVCLKISKGVCKGAVKVDNGGKWMEEKAQECPGEIVLEVPFDDLKQWVSKRIKELYHLPENVQIDVSLTPQSGGWLTYQINYVHHTNEHLEITYDFFLNSHHWVLIQVAEVGYLLDGGFEVADVVINSEAKEKDWAIQYALKGDLLKVHLT